MGGGGWVGCAWHDLPGVASFYQPLLPDTSLLCAFLMLCAVTDFLTLQSVGSLGIVGSPQLKDLSGLSGLGQVGVLLCMTCLCETQFHYRYTSRVQAPMLNPPML
jgi:hypothetical protein